MRLPGRFEHFYLQEYPKVVALAHALSGSRAGAEDIAQEAFLRAYRDWDRVGSYEHQGPPGSGAWPPNATGIGVGTRVLDLGSGAGGFLRGAADQGADVAGLDAAFALLAIAEAARVTRRGGRPPGRPRRHPPAAARRPRPLRALRARGAGVALAGGLALVTPAGVVLACRPRTDAADWST